MSWYLKILTFYFSNICTLLKNTSRPTCGGNWHPVPHPLPNLNHPSEAHARAARPESAPDPAISTQPQHRGRHPAPNEHGTNHAEKGIHTRNTHTQSSSCLNQTQRKPAQLTPEDTEPPINRGTKPKRAAPDRADTSSLPHAHPQRKQRNWTGLDHSSSWPPPAPRVGAEHASGLLVGGSPPVWRREGSATPVSPEHTSIIDVRPLSVRPVGIVDRLSSI